jgi:hypothetical protein
LPVSFIAIPLLYSRDGHQQVLSSIDPSSARIDDFVSLKDRESKAERRQGSMGNKIED